MSPESRGDPRHTEEGVLVCGVEGPIEIEDGTLAVGRKRSPSDQKPRSLPFNLAAGRAWDLGQG